MARGLATTIAVFGGQAARAAAVLEASPSNVDCGDQRVGTTTTSGINVAVTNTDTTTFATTIVCSVENDGAFHDAGSFTCSPACPTSLAPGGTFNIDVSLAPTAVGALGAKLHITYDKGLGAGGIDHGRRLPQNGHQGLGKRTSES